MTQVQMLHDPRDRAKKIGLGDKAKYTDYRSKTKNTETRLQKRRVELSVLQSKNNNTASSKAFCFDWRVIQYSDLGQG